MRLCGRAAGSSRAPLPSSANLHAPNSAHGKAALLRPRPSLAHPVRPRRGEGGAEAQSETRGKPQLPGSSQLSASGARDQEGSHQGAAVHQFFFIDFDFCLAAEIKRGQDSAGNTPEDSWRERDSPGNAATAPVVGAQAGARGAGDAPVCKEQAARTPPARSGLGGGGGRPRGRARAAAAPGQPPLRANPAPWPGSRDTGDASSQLTKPTRPANKTTNATLRLKACRTGTAFPGHGVTFL